jgi:pimeloyl-ACP methyl ester carboxylesterase
MTYGAQITPTAGTAAPTDHHVLHAAIAMGPHVRAAANEIERERRLPQAATTRKPWATGWRIRLPAWRLGSTTSSPPARIAAASPSGCSRVTRCSTTSRSTYWVTNSATSSSQLYWENKDNVFNAVDISIPVAVTVFPGEIYRAPRSWAERNYHKLIYWNEVDKGGHFAAFEQPELFTAEIQAAFRSLR